MNLTDLDDFFQHYLVCALWASNDESTPEGGEPMDATYDLDDFAPVVLVNLKAECADFIEANLTDLVDLDAEQCGHDFWLTRNHHGAGFWDRGYGALGKRLSDASHAYGSCDLYIGDDGKVWAFGYETAQS